MKFNVEKAKEAGYSDQEIETFLAKDQPKKFNVEKAKASGYSDEEIEDFLSKESTPKKFGDKGSIVGGMAGRIIEAASEYPSLLATEAPRAAIQFGQGLADLQDPIPAILSLISGKPRPSAAEMYSDYSRKDLPEHLKQGAQDIANLEELLLPIPGLKGISGASKLKPRAPRPGPSIARAESLSGRARSVFPDTPPGGPPSLPSSQSLVKEIIGSDLPISSYETAEQALKEINPAPNLGLKKGDFKVELTPQSIASEKSLVNKVDRIEGPGSAISAKEFETEAAGGRALNNTIRDTAAAERAKVSEAYKIAEENYKNINSIADDTLIGELREEISKLRESAKPNTAEASVLKTLEDVSNYYLTRNGVPVRTLVKTSDSLSGMANYELPFTGPKDILKRVANSLDRAAIRAVENNGGDASLIKSANQKYGKWANRYSNDDITPFMEKTVNNPESLFRKAIDDEGAFRAVEGALPESNKAKEFSNALSRKIAETKLGKFKSSEIGSHKYQESLRNLKALIGEERAIAYDKALRQINKTPPPPPAPDIKNTYPGSKLERLINKISEHKKLKPEDVLEKLNTRSGIKELKKTLSEKNFDTLIKQKARTILQEGNIEQNFTGDELYKILNKEANFEIFTEILGAEEAQALREAAKAIGKENMSAERILNFFKVIGKEAVKSVLGVKALKILISLIA